MRHATITDPDGDRLLIHGTPEALFLTVRSEDGTRTAGGFTRAQLEELLDTVTPMHARPGLHAVQLPTDPDAVPDHLIMTMLDALGARQPGKRLGQHPALLVTKLRRGIAALATARSDEDEAAARLRDLLTAYGEQDADADDYEGRLSVYLARHGARVEGTR